jgi:hypothetical protein
MPRRLLAASFPMLIVTCLQCGEGHPVSRAGGDWSGVWISDAGNEGGSFTFRVNDEQVIAGPVDYLISAGLNIPFPCPQIIRGSVSISETVSPSQRSITAGSFEFQFVDFDGSQLGVTGQLDLTACDGQASGNLTYAPPSSSECPARGVVWIAYRGDC